MFIVFSLCQRKSSEWTQSSTRESEGLPRDSGWRWEEGGRPSVSAGAPAAAAGPSRRGGGLQRHKRLEMRGQMLSQAECGPRSGPSGSRSCAGFCTARGRRIPQTSTRPTASLALQRFGRTWVLQGWGVFGPLPVPVCLILLMLRGNAHLTSQEIYQRFCGSRCEERPLCI